MTGKESTFHTCYPPRPNMSFESPSNSLSRVDLEASNKSPVYVAVAVGFVIATGGVILRGVARRKSKTPLGWDDYTILLALVSYNILYTLYPACFLLPRPQLRGKPSEALKGGLDAPLRPKHLHASSCDKIRTRPTSSCCTFHGRCFPKGWYLFYS